MTSEPTGDPTVYRHSSTMSEISGFGGGYESCCQDMLEAGVKWLLAHPQANLQISEYTNVFGLVNAESPDAKLLQEVIFEASQGEATGAMMHGLMRRLFYIHSHGWESYCKEMESQKSQESSDE